MAYATGWLSWPLTPYWFRKLKKKETLTIVFGCECFHQYLYGKEMEVESDHNTLEAVFDKSITKAPPRIQRLLLQWQYYRLKVKYVPGKQMFIADALSRAHLKTTYTIYGSVPDSKTEMQVYFLLANLSNLMQRKNQRISRSSNSRSNSSDSRWSNMDGLATRGTCHAETYWRVKEEVYVELMEFSWKITRWQFQSEEPVISCTGQTWMHKYQIWFQLHFMPKIQTGQTMSKSHWYSMKFPIGPSKRSPVIYLPLEARTIFWPLASCVTALWVPKSPPSILNSTFARYGIPMKSLEITVLSFQAANSNSFQSCGNLRIQLQPLSSHKLLGK